MPPFRVFKLRGDGSLHFVQETKPSKTQERVRDFAELWPGEYIVEVRKLESAWSFVQTAKRRIEWKTAGVSVGRSYVDRQNRSHIEGEAA
jgi:hypothetical protein